VLHSENASVADRIQHGEQLLKVDLPGPRFLATGRVGKLDIAEHVASLHEQASQILTGDNLLIHVEQQPARRTPDGSAQLGRLIRGPQKQP